MTVSLKSVSLVGASLLMLGASLGAVEAMPISPLTPGVQASADIEQAAYLHQSYPGYHSRSARRYRHARRNTPNRYCQNQPSRCR